MEIPIDYVCMSNERYNSSDDINKGGINKLLSKST
jgi:hypothetical protein